MPHLRKITCVTHLKKIAAKVCDDAASALVGDALSHGGTPDG
jgi:hypothetical protein